MTAGKVPEVGALGAAEKKVRMLEQQRTEVGGWRERWWLEKTPPHSRDQQDKDPPWPPGSG